MKRITIIILITLGLISTAWADNIDVLKNMFTNMVVKKDISDMPKYYTSDFELYSNGKTMNYKQYYLGHKSIYKTSIQYQIAYDENTFVKNNNKVAVRMFITTKMPHSKANKIEVILIAQFRKHKISKLWELTYPNWSKLKSFKSFSK